MIARRLTKHIKRAVAFVQPVLTANRTLGGNAFAVAASSYVNSARAPWKAVDGITSSSDGENYVWHSNSGSSWWFTFYNPTAINVTKIAIQNSAFSGHKAITGGTISASNDGANWTTLTSWTNSNITANAWWNIDLSSNIGFYKYYRINITSSAYNGYAVIGELAITATEGK